MMRIKHTIITFLLIFLLSETFAETDSLEPIGHWAVGPCQTVTADSSILFIGNGSMIDIFKIDTPDTVITVGDFHADGPVEKLEIHDSLLFVYIYDDVISIYNIANPNNPYKLSSTKFDSYIRQLYVHNTFLYVTLWDSKLSILDINDPSTPILVSETDIPGYPLGICVVDSLAYVGVRDSGLMILNINDPNSIVSIATLPVHNNHWVSHIKYNNDLLYIGTQSVFDDNAFIRILDISNPTHPIKRGNISLGGDWSSGTKNIYIEDTLAYVIVNTDVGDYLRIINTADTANLTLEYSIEIDDAQDVFVRDNLCYIAAGSGGLQVYDWAIGHHNLVHHYQTNGSCSGIYVKDQCAFIASGDAGLRAININDPENPEVIGSFDEPTVGLGSAYDIVIEDDYAYVINISGPLNILDISDPENISEVSWLHGPYGYALCVKNDHLYVANRDYGLFVANISDPLNPTKVCTLDVSTGAYDIAVKDTLIFLACASEGTKIISVSDPVNPIVIATINTTGRPIGVSYEDNTLYIAERENGLMIYNISDPKNPIELGHYSDNSWFSKVQAKGNVAFVTDRDLGLLALDVQNPDSIELLGNYKPPSGVSKIFLNQNMIYATAGRDGFYIFNNTLSSSIISIPTTTTLHQNYPNPLNPTTTISYELPEAQNITLQIFDITGRLVETLYNGYKEAGHWDVTWNASNHSSGIYIYRLQVGDRCISKKMVVLK